MGREAALAALRAGWAAAVAGRGRLLQVVGEPGIGKTAVLEAAAKEAADGGGLVLWGQCWDGDGAPAYWPWVQVLRAGITAGGVPGEAQWLLPGHAPGPDAGADGGRFRLFDAVVRLLSGLAEERPVLAVLDDLQWADVGSLRLLEFAAHHLRAAPVLLLGAYRDEEAGRPLRRLSGVSGHVPLSGLAHADVAAVMTSIAGTAPTEASVADVCRRTGGNPFLVGELTRLLVAQGGAAGVAAPAGPLLERVGDVLERRMARLSQRCADVLTVAAVAGPEVRPEVLAHVVTDAHDLVALLDEAAGARVLVEPRDAVAPYRFSHDLVRETVLAGMPAEQRVRLHLAVGRALETLQAEGTAVHPAELAAHFTAAAALAPHAAVRHGMLAGQEAAARLAFEESRDHDERALAALDLMTAPDTGLRLELLLRLGDSRNRAGDAPGAREALRDAAGLARARADATGLARAAVGMHALGSRTGFAESIALLEEALAALPATPSARRAGVLAGLARDLHHSRRGEGADRALELAERAVADARGLHDPATLAFCLLAEHDVRWVPGGAAHRLPVVEQMLVAAREAGARDLVVQAGLLRATALVELGDRRGLDELRAYCEGADGLGHARARYGALSRRATLELIAGSLGRAERLAEDARELGTAIGEPDAAGVHEALRWAVRRAGGTGDALTLGSDPWPGTPLAEAVLAAARGDTETAGRALGALDVDALFRTRDLEAAAFAAQVAAVAGTPAQRGRLYDRLGAYAGSHVVVGGCASYLGAVDHTLGLLAASLGREQDARRHLDEATEMYRRLGAVAWVERSRADAGARPHGTAGDEGVLRRRGDVWTIRFRGTESHCADVKGLHDLAVLVARAGEPVHAVELQTGSPPSGGADAVLDDQAKSAYRRRLGELESDLDEAESRHDLHRAERARLERDALLAELSSAVGLGGRDRRLGDERERARKAVTARIHDAMERIGRADPQLAAHLRASVTTGTWCTYQPADPVRWRL